MPIKIAGLNKLQKQLQDVQRAMRSLAGPIVNLHFDPNEPASIQSAVTHMETAIDEMTASYRTNPLVQDLTSQMERNL